jgi:NADH dehydrogenase (ubiquinone) 1 alpha subcomplex subunit 4
MGGAGLLATWYLTRLAFGPDVVWNRKGNPHPWNTIKPNESTKLMDPHGRFTASWKRNAL